MITLAATLRAFFHVSEPAVLVTLVEAKGSTPREKGATMLVTAFADFGTIGGGQMEYLAIGEARRLIASGQRESQLDFPLGPTIGQCCGGHVRIALKLADAAALGELELSERQMRAGLRHVYLFGAGHVGFALAHAFAPMPLVLHVVETREGELAGLPQEARTHLTALPETVVSEAPAGSAFIVLTHDHALDFIITSAALERQDAAYVGLIGSSTKRASFASWHGREGHDKALLAPLVCPIGGSAVRDKRPEVIAALVAAEVIHALHAAPLHRQHRGEPSFGGKGEG